MSTVGNLCTAHLWQISSNLIEHFHSSEIADRKLFIEGLVFLNVCITNYSTGIRLPTLRFIYSWVCMTQERGDIPNKVISGAKAPPTFSNLLHMRGSQSEEKCLKREINSLFNIEDNLRGFIEVQHEINKDYFEL